MMRLIKMLLIFDSSENNIALCIKRILFLIIISAACANGVHADDVDNDFNGNNENNRVVCYYGKSFIENQPPELLEISKFNTNFCTHVIWSSIIFNNNNELTFSNAGAVNVTSALAGFIKRKQINVKALLSWGGWTENLEMYQRMIQNEYTLQNMVTKLRNMVLSLGFNGLDVDLTFDKVLDVDEKLQLHLMYKLRQEFLRYKLMLTVAVSGNVNVMNTCYNIKELEKYVDLINVKAFNLTDLNTATSLLAPLRRNQQGKYDTVEASIANLIYLGAPKSKLILGVPTVGLLYNLKYRSYNKPGSPVIKPPIILAYSKICLMWYYKVWNMNYEEIEQVDWSYLNNQWISTPSINSTKAKAKLAKELGLGGVAAWGIGWDDHSQLCGKKWPILRALNEIMRPDICDVDGSPPQIYMTLGTMHPSFEEQMEALGKKKPYCKPSQNTTGSWTGQPINPSGANNETTTTPQSNQDNQQQGQQEQGQQEQQGQEGQWQQQQGQTVAVVAQLLPGYRCNKEGFIRHPTDTTKYYRCVYQNGNYLMYFMHCPNGYIFNSQWYLCQRR